MNLCAQHQTKAGGALNAQPATPLIMICKLVLQLPLVAQTCGRTLLPAIMTGLSTAPAPTSSATIRGWDQEKLNPAQQAEQHATVPHRTQHTLPRFVRGSPRPNSMPSCHCWVSCSGADQCRAKCCTAGTLAVVDLSRKEGHAQLGPASLCEIRRSTMHAARVPDRRVVLEILARASGKLAIRSNAGSRPLSLPEQTP